MSQPTSEGAGGLLSRIPRFVVWGVAGVLGLVLVAVLVGFVVSSRPHFLGQYASFESNTEALTSSTHDEVACDACHVDSRGPVVSSAALVGDFYRGLVNRPDEPVFVELATPTNDACLDCHLHDWSSDSSRTIEIPHPAHLRVAEETRECVECHKWTAHEEDYIERHKTMPFSGVCASFGCHAGWKSVDECASCHHAVKEDGPAWILDHRDAVQEIGPNSCVESCHDIAQCQQCHTTGVRPEFPEIGPDSGLRAIEKEHVKADWMEQHGSFAIDDDSKCFDCHVSPAECQDCHSDRPEFHGLKTTWLNRHAELLEEEGGDERSCLTCHEKDWCEECHEQFEETS